MKYLLLLTFVHLTTFFCSAQNRDKGIIEYELGNGGTVVLSKRTYDSLRTITFSSDSTSATSTVDKDKIFRFYQDKCTRLFSSMQGLVAPDFEAKDSEGYVQKASKYRGRVLILHFWSFWGNSFENEIPELNRLQAKYEKNGLAILSFTGVPLGEDELKKLKENPLKFPLIGNAYLFADDFFKTKLMRPCVVIIDKNGLMSSFYEGSMLPKNRQNSSAPLDFDFEDKINVLIK